MQFSA